MATTRRSFLIKAFTAVTLGLMGRKGRADRGNAQKKAWPEALFEPASTPDAITLYTGGAPLIETSKIQLQAPKVAEDGASVPISVSGSLPNVETLALFVENSPVALAGEFSFAPSSLPFVSAKLKITQSGDVIVIAKADGLFYCARKAISVTLSACGL